MLFDMRNYWPGRYLMIFNTHLDPTSPDNRAKQLYEIKNFMDRIWKNNRHVSSIGSQNIGVLLMGDFNIPSTSEEYNFLRETLGGPSDLYLDHIKKTGKQEQWTYERSNPLFTSIHGDMRIDYVFAFDSVAGVPAMQLDCPQLEIVKQKEEELLSDHWPQVMTLQPRLVFKYRWRF